MQRAVVYSKNPAAHKAHLLNVKEQVIYFRPYGATLDSVLEQLECIGHVVKKFTYVLVENVVLIEKGCGSETNQMAPLEQWKTESM